MRNQLLTGVAALALVAGTGLAFAQGDKAQSSAPPAAQSAPPAAEKGGAPTAAKPATPGPAKMNQGAQMDQGAKFDKGAKIDQGAKGGEPTKMGQGAPTKTPPTQQSVEDRNRAGTGATADEHKAGEPGKTADEHGAKGGNLSADQRSKIGKLVINERGAPRVGHVDFDVRVGTVIPRDRVHAVPVPESIVVIEPEWRGFLYFLVGNEIVIVEPGTMRIVAVIEA